MGKIIISQKFLGNYFINVALAHAQTIGNIKNVDLLAFQNDLNNAKSPEEFAGAFDKYFGDDLKLVE